MILFTAILIFHNLVNAWVDAYKIKRLNKRIRHGVNLLAYLATTIVMILILKLQGVDVVAALISAFCNRQLTFDITLNLLRGLRWDYVTPERPPKAVMDQIELWLFGENGKTPVIIYLFAWLTTTIYLL